MSEETVTKHLQENKIYKEKSIPMIALWCPAFKNHGWLSCLKHNSLL